MLYSPYVLSTCLPIKQEHTDVACWCIFVLSFLPGKNPLTNICCWSTNHQSLSLPPYLPYPCPDNKCQWCRLKSHGWLIMEIQNPDLGSDRGFRRSVRITETLVSAIGFQFSAIFRSPTIGLRHFPRLISDDHRWNGDNPKKECSLVGITTCTMDAKTKSHMR